MSQPVVGHGTTRPRYLPVLAAILVTLGLLSAPLAIAGKWASTQVLDNSNFTNTLGPLASEPAVQDFVVEQATTSILERVEPGTLGSLLPGWLPGAASDRLEARFTAVLGEAISRVVDSRAFATVWERGIQTSHEHAVRVLRSQSPTVAVDQAGRLSLDTGTLLEQLTSDSSGEQLPWARMIPEIEHEIVLLEYSGLDTARQWVGYIDAVSWWLPWASGALLLAGVLLYRGILPLSLGLLGLVTALGAGLVDWSGRWIAQWAIASGQPAQFTDLLFERLTLPLRQQLVGIAVIAAVLAVIVLLLRTLRAQGAGRRRLLIRALGYAVVLAVGLVFLLGVPSSLPLLLLLTAAAGTGLATVHGLDAR